MVKECTPILKPELDVKALTMESHLTKKCSFLCNSVQFSIIYNSLILV